jgi:shikimate dehydrogenase
MHNAALHALDLDWRYDPFAVAPAQLATFIAQAAKSGFRGLNITIPHKEAALGLCTPDELARRVGAVNTLVFDDAAVHGYNTDVYGFAMLLNAIGASGDGAAVVLGAGGAARAVAAALLGRARALTIVARSARRLSIGDDQLAVTPWDQATLPTLLASTDLLIDATPRGLAADATLDLAPLPAHAVVIDLVVQRVTNLVQTARARGLYATTGTEMLLHQGARALELWTGRAAPLEVMRDSLNAAL